MLSPTQKKFVLDPNRRKLARCGRRAGKSFMDAVYLIIECLRNPNSPVLYAGLTRDSAKEIIWPILTEILEQLDIPCTMRPSALMVEFPNGSKITIFGCDAQNARNRLRGRKFRLVIFDETAFYASLDPLIYALLPMLADYGGTICLTSSPGELLTGLFYEADQGKKKEHWSCYQWRIHDNPFFQATALDSKYKTRAEEEIAIVLETEFDGDATRPEFKREWLGEWVEDHTALVYPCGPGNLIPNPFKMPEAMHAIGINLSSSFNHSVAIGTYSLFDRRFLIVRSWTVADLELDDFVSRLKADIDKYEPVIITAYTGKYSSKIVDEMKRRYKLPLVHMDSSDITFHQRVFASDLANGYIQLVKDRCLQLIGEFGKLVRDKSGHEIDGQENYASMAALSLYRKIYSTTLQSYEPPKSDEERHIEQLENRRFIEPTPWHERYEHSDY